MTFAGFSVRNRFTSECSRDRLRSTFACAFAFVSGAESLSGMIRSETGEGRNGPDTVVCLLLDGRFLLQISAAHAQAASVPPPFN